MNKPDKKELAQLVRANLSAIKKTLFGSNGSNTSTTPATASPVNGKYCYQLDDGTLVQSEQPIDVGVNVEVVTEQGASPIPDGQYTVDLDDGTQLTIVTQGGVVTTATPSNDTPVKNKKTTPQTPSNDVQAQLAKHADTLSQHADLIKQCMDKLGIAEKQNQHMRKQLATQQQAFGKALETMELMAHEPVDAPAQPVFNPFKKQAAHSKEQVLKLMAEQR